MTAPLRHQPAIDASLAAQMVPFRTVVPPVNIDDAEAFPEIARAIAGLADLSPERREQLEREWGASGVDRTLLAMKGEIHG